MSKFQEFDFIVAIDASSSMLEPNKNSAPNGPTRWQAAQELVLGLTRQIQQYDDDGIDVVRFGGRVETFQGVTADKVKDIFATGPMGSTPTTEALQACLTLAGKSSKKDMIIILTDGEPNSEQSLRDLIVRTANSQTQDDALTILFIQVGDNTQATAFLKRLDDGLNTKFDIVDAKTVEEIESLGSVDATLEAAIAD